MNDDPPCSHADLPCVQKRTNRTCHSCFLDVCIREEMALALPPSSMMTGLRCLPAVAAMIDPTAVLPVKFIFLIAGCVIRVFVVSAASWGLWKTRSNTLAGRPASRMMSAMAQ